MTGPQLPRLVEGELPRLVDGDEPSNNQGLPSLVEGELPSLVEGEEIDDTPAGRRRRALATGTPFQLATRERLLTRFQRGARARLASERAVELHESDPANIPSSGAVAMHVAKRLVTEIPPSIAHLAGLMGVSAATRVPMPVVAGGAHFLAGADDLLRYGDIDQVTRALQEPAEFERMFAMENARQQYDNLQGVTEPGAIAALALTRGRETQLTPEQFREQLTQRLAAFRGLIADHEIRRGQLEQDILEAQSRIESLPGDVPEMERANALEVLRISQNLLSMEPETNAGAVRRNSVRAAAGMTGTGFKFIIANSLHDIQIARERNDLTTIERADKMIDAAENIIFYWMGHAGPKVRGVTRAGVRARDAREAQEAENLIRRTLGIDVTETPVTEADVDAARAARPTRTQELRARLGLPVEVATEPAPVREPIAPVIPETPIVPGGRIEQLRTQLGLEAEPTPEVTASYVPTVSIEPPARTTPLARELEAQEQAPATAELASVAEANASPDRVLILTGRVAMPPKGTRTVYVPEKNLTYVFREDAAPQLINEARENGGLYTGSRVSYGGEDFVIDEIKSDGSVDMMNVNTNHILTLPRDMAARNLVPSAGVNGAAVVTYKGQRYYIRGGNATSLVLDRPGKPPLVVKRENVTHVPGTQEYVEGTLGSIQNRFKLLKEEYRRDPVAFVRNRLGIDLRGGIRERPAAELRGRDFSELTKMSTAELTVELVKSTRELEPDNEYISAVHHELSLRLEKPEDAINQAGDLLGALRSEEGIGDVTSRVPSEIGRLIIASHVGQARQATRAKPSFTTRRFPGTDAIYTALANELGLTNVTGLLRFLEAQDTKANREAYMTPFEVENLRTNKPGEEPAPYITHHLEGAVPASVHAMRNGLQMDIDLDGHVILRDPVSGSLVARLEYRDNLTDAISSVIQKRTTVEAESPESNLGPEVALDNPEVAAEPFAGLPLDGSATPPGYSGRANNGAAYDGTKRLDTEPEGIISRLIGTGPSGGGITGLLGAARAPWFTLATERFYAHDARAGGAGTQFGRLAQTARDIKNQGAAAAVRLLRRLNLEGIAGRRRGMKLDQIQEHGRALYTRTAAELETRYNMTNSEKLGSEYIEIILNTMGGDAIDFKDIIRAVDRQMKMRDAVKNKTLTDSEQRVIDRFFEDHSKLDLTLPEFGIYMMLVEMINSAAKSNEDARTAAIDMNKEIQRAVKNKAAAEAAAARASENPTDKAARNYARRTARVHRNSAHLLDVKPPDVPDPFSFRVDLVTRHALSKYKNTPSTEQYMRERGFTDTDKSIVRDLQRALNEIAVEFSMPVEEVYKILDIDSFVKSNSELMPQELQDVMLAHSGYRGRLGEPIPKYRQIWNQFVETGEFNPYEADPVLTVARLARAAIERRDVIPKLNEIERMMVRDISALRTAEQREQAEKDVKDFTTALRGMPDAAFDVINYDLTLAISKILEAVGVKNAAQRLRDRALVQEAAFHISTGMSNRYMAFRPGQGVRDLSSAVQWSAVTFDGKFALDVFAEFTQIAASAFNSRFRGKPEGMAKFAEDIARLGLESGVSPMLMELKAEEMRDPRYSQSKLGAMYRTFSELGMDMTFQQQVYDGMRLATYRIARGRANEVINTLVREGTGNLTKAQIRELYLDRVHPLVARDVVNIAKTQGADAALDFYGKYMITRNLPPYGFGEGPRHWNGIAGKLITKFGFYPAFTVNRIQDIASYGSAGTRLWRLSKMAMIDAAIWGIGKGTGYDTKGYMMTPAILWGGSPFLTEMLRGKARAHETGTQTFLRILRTITPFLGAKDALFGKDTNGAMEWFMNVFLSLKKKRDF